MVRQEIRDAGKKINPDFAFAVEEPCEYFIPYSDLYMGRPYALFGTGFDPSTHRVAVPLFLYVYHEYLLGYGGSNEIDVSHPYAEAIKIARKFVNGTMLEIDPGKPAFRLETMPFPTAELQLARSCSRALRSFAKPYLISGRMLRDPEMQDLKTVRARMWRDNTTKTRIQDLQTTDIPLVLQSTWAAGGKVGYVFANWQTSKQSVVFAPRNYLKDPRGHRLTSNSAEATHLLQKAGPLPHEVRVEIPPMSTLMVEQQPE